MRGKKKKNRHERHERKPLVEGKYISAASTGPYLRIQRWRLEAELVNVGKKRPVQLLSGCWHVQAALPLLLSHNFCIARGSFVGKKASIGLAFERLIETGVEQQRASEAEPTFGPLGQTHAQPAHAALAAHAGRAGAEGVQGDGSDDQRQVQGQVYGAGDVDVHLCTDKKTPEQVSGQSGVAIASLPDGK